MSEGKKLTTEEKRIFRNRGRKLKIKTPEELQKKCDDFFKKCDKEKRPYTITGLALALDIDRASIINYQSREEFFDIIKKAKTKCENYLEEGMLENRLNPTGSIFVLKNNHGWTDKQDITTNGQSIQPITVQFLKIPEKQLEITDAKSIK